MLNFEYFACIYLIKLKILLFFHLKNMIIEPFSFDKHHFQLFSLSSIHFSIVHLKLIAFADLRLSL